MAHRYLKGLLIAGVCAAAASAASAQEQNFEFVFVHHEDELENNVTARKLYSRLQEEAAAKCAEAGRDDAASNCTAMTINRIVAGLGDSKLTKAHKDAGGKTPGAAAGAHFFFAMDDEAFDTFSETRVLYDRLQDEARGYCAGRGGESDVDACTRSIVDRAVVNIDHYGLSHRHSKEKRKGAVYIFDE